MSGENKAAMKRIGYFGEAGYVGIGDPYKSKHKESMSRYEGAQFQTNPKFVSDTRFKLTNGVFSKAAALYVVRYMSITLLDDKQAHASFGTLRDYSKKTQCLPRFFPFLHASSRRRE